MQVGKGTVQVAVMLRKPLLCFMKQKGQAVISSPWQGGSCPSRVAQGSSWDRGMWGVQGRVKDNNGTTTSSFAMGLQGGMEAPVP